MRKSNSQTANKKTDSAILKLIAVIFIMFLLQIGYQIPLPGIDSSQVTIATSGSFLSIATGNALSQMSIFALSITPYITASIILQLLTIIVPPLWRLKKSGSVGEKKMETLTYILGGIVALGESIFLVLSYGNNGLIVDYVFWQAALDVCIWTAGAIFLIFVGTYITNHLVGDGVSIMLLFNLTKQLAGSLMTVEDIKWWIICILAISLYVILAYIYYIDNTELRISVVGSHNLSEENKLGNYVPFKLCSGGVMPIIFASSLFSIIQIVFDQISSDSAAVLFFQDMFTMENWFDTSDFLPTIGVVVYVGFIVMFSYFYQKISFDYEKISTDFRKSGINVVGVRPGDDTTQYLKRSAKKILWKGALAVSLAAILPSVLVGFLNIDGLEFGGTTLLILVNVLNNIWDKMKAETSTNRFKKVLL